MTTSFAGRLHALSTGPERLCVGVDPHPKTLAAWGLADSPSGLLDFQTAMLEAMIEQRIAITKPQVALYERHGVEGMRVLAQFIQQARQSGLLVIADVKRGDIGTSLAGYAQAWLAPGSDFESDAMTTVAYQGVGSLEPAFEVAAASGKSVFILAATSNPEGLGVQSAVTSEGYTVARDIIDSVQNRSSLSPHGESGWLGVVIGATVNRVSLDITAESLTGLSVLVPGFGAQGVSLSSFDKVVGGQSHLVIPTVSRSVAGDSRSGLGERIRVHQSELAA